MTIRIGNVRDGDVGEYVGRRARRRANGTTQVFARSPLANPFRVGTDGSLQVVIAKYRSWLTEAIETVTFGEPLRRELERLRELAKRPEGVTLLCWCAPKPCHAEIIREVLLSERFAT